MKKFVVALGGLLFSAFAISCSTQRPALERSAPAGAGAVVPSASPSIPVASGIKDYFNGARGCFLLFNVKSKSFEKVIGEPVCREQFPAFSTFKIPLAVMAFDSGALTDENQILVWDGVKRDRTELNQDHNAKSWMRDSVVWFSQRLTPKIGAKRVQKYLRDFHYGNEDLSGGLTKAWLVRPNSPGPALRISAYEQVEFMDKLFTGRLKVTPRSMKLTRDITFLETSPRGFNLNGKTGSNFFDDSKKQHFGWFIGHLEDVSKEYIVVTNLSDLQPTSEPGPGGARAKKITKEILTAEGLW